MSTSKMYENFSIDNLPLRCEPIHQTKWINIQFIGESKLFLIVEIKTQYTNLTTTTTTLIIICISQFVKSLKIIKIYRHYFFFTLISFNLLLSSFQSTLKIVIIFTSIYHFYYWLVGWLVCWWGMICDNHTLWSLDFMFLLLDDNKQVWTLNKL